MELLILAVCSLVGLYVSRPVIRTYYAIAENTDNRTRSPARRLARG